MLFCIVVITEGCVTPIQDQTEADTEEKEFEEQLEESVVKEEVVEEQAAPDLTEEEKEAKRLEQEYFEKQQKVIIFRNLRNFCCVSYFKNLIRSEKCSRSSSNVV